MSAGGGAPTAEEERFLTHLGRAGELVGARRLEEAEVEVLRALSVLPSERRAMNLLALVRFKLGRVDEAWETYREIATMVPDDAGVRLNLGLLALKLERIEEAVAELEHAGRLAPGDLRVWSYLGFAYARRGESQLAATAFRRAGQAELANEIERAESRGDEPAQVAPTQAAMDAVPDDSAAARPEAAPAAPVPPPLEGLRPEPTRLSGPLLEAPEAPPPEPELTVAAFALANLLPGRGPAAADRGWMRLVVQDEAHVRTDAAVALSGDLAAEAGRRRARGRFSDEALAGGGMLRLRGQGEVWLGGRALLALTLEDDILFFREERVVAFDADVAWEAGRLPGADLGLLQFRGRGRVTVSLGPSFVTLKLDPERPTTIARDRLLGWIGRVVPRGVLSGWAGAVVCEGEGVLVLAGEPVEVSAA